MKLVMSAPEIEQLIVNGFGPEPVTSRIETLRRGFVRTRLPFEPSMVRPGNVLSGPTLFMAADLAMYALVLAHIGPELMAVTSQLSINFLSKAPPADVVSEGTLLKLGRTLAVMEVRLFSGEEPTIVAHATGTYSLPTRRGKGS